MLIQTRFLTTLMPSPLHPTHPLLIKIKTTVNMKWKALIWTKGVGRIEGGTSFGQKSGSEMFWSISHWDLFHWSILHWGDDDEQHATNMGQSTALHSPYFIATRVRDVVIFGTKMRMCCDLCDQYANVLWFLQQSSMLPKFLLPTLLSESANKKQNTKGFFSFWEK